MSWRTTEISAESLRFANADGFLMLEEMDEMVDLSTIARAEKPPKADGKKSKKTADAAPADGVSVELVDVRRTFYPPIIGFLLSELYKSFDRPASSARQAREEKFKSMSEEKLHAVDGVCLRLRAEQIFALLGHNGAGKTTAIKIATAQIAPSGGDVSVHGRSVRA